MGDLMRLFFDNEYLQRSDIDDTRRRLEVQRRMERASRQRLRDDLEARIESLEDDVGHLALFVRTLLRLLSEKGTVGRDEFILAAHAIDAHDGNVDGKYTGPLDAP